MTNPGLRHRTQLALLLPLAVLVVAACHRTTEHKKAPPVIKLPPVLTLGDASRRFSIQPTREFGELCAWSEVSLGPPYSDSEHGESAGIGTNCAIEVKTILPYVVVGGPSDLEVDWAGVLGLAEKRVERVVLQRADGSRKELPLKPWPQTPWSSFSFDFRPRPFPALVFAYGAKGRLLAKTDLGERIRPACLVDEVCAKDRERYRGPSMNAYLGGSDPVHWLPQEDARRTYELVMNDPRLRKILGPSRYWVEEYGLWLTCDWNDKLGTWANVRLAKRGTFQANWPYVKLTPDGNSYRGRAKQRTVSRVRSFLVVVDLERDRVVTIDPFKGGPWFSGDSILTVSDERMLYAIIGPSWVGQTDCNPE